MIVEILGAKMLAPYLGTSHFVWTAQIAVTLLALAAGYYVGGWWVDRWPRAGLLYAGYAIAALYLAGTVRAIEPVASMCLKYPLSAGALLASVFLFFMPLFLLAMTGPVLVRLLTRSLNGMGGSVGRLTALGTLGSFAGTLSIGFVLIPRWPNSRSMTATAMVLMALAVGYALVSRRSRKSKILLLSVAASAVLASAGVLRKMAGHGTNPRYEELFRGNSNFGMMQVVEDRRQRDYRYYLNDFLIQNTWDSVNRRSLSMFTYMLHGLARAYTRQTEEVLCIGLGVGVVAMDFAREGARVEAVEINPAVVPLAERYFNLEPDRIRIAFGDGRQFLCHNERRYEAIILDAFLGDAPPSHLMTREAFAAMKEALHPDGVLVMNSFGGLEAGRDFGAASLEKTLRAVFPEVRMHNHANEGSLFLVASASPLRIQRPPSFAQVHPVCRDRVRQAFGRLVQTDPRHGMILTDDYNPLEFYDAANREHLRRQLAISAMGL